MEMEEVALKNKRAEMLFAHREVRPRHPHLTDEIHTSRPGARSTQGKSAAATAFQAATHAPITDGTRARETPCSRIVR